ncbi:hypothetical protein F4779DRAFT_618261 [Xylariaceae sp. FL0662B]|nr:hypothetical protein F4779DRAFT_618261 [Xylariaceae sp. FL0662B]
MAGTEANQPDFPLTPHVGHRTNAIIWVLIALATAFLGLRVFCKFKKRKGLWYDDWLLIVSWITLLAAGILSSVSIYVVFGGLDKIMDTTESKPDGIILLNFVMGCLFFLGAAWSKTSFAITLLRIAKPKIKTALWSIIISMNIVVSISVIMRWAQCQPFRKTWEPHAEGNCLDRDAILGFTIYAGAYSALMDFVLAFIPWPIITKLQMQTSEKIGISVAMSMGVFAGATAIVKCVKLKVLVSASLTNDLFDLSIWSVAEIATTIMAASIPVLRTLVREATGTNGRPSCPVVYIRDKSRVIIPRARESSNGTATENTASTKRESKPAKSSIDFESDKAALNTPDTGHQIEMMEEVHIQFTDRECNESPSIELGTVARSYHRWV